MIQWNELTTNEQLNNIIEESNIQPVLIYKHSTRCSISAASLDRLERKWDSNRMANWKPYFLDLITHRSVSNAIEAGLGIEHQSPQAIVLFKGKPVYDASHFGISLEGIASSVPAMD